MEFVPEILFEATYRKSLTTIFPRFLKAMSVYHEEQIKQYFCDVFGFDGSIDIDSMFSENEIVGIIRESLRTKQI